MITLRELVGRILTVTSEAERKTVFAVYGGIDHEPGDVLRITTDPWVAIGAALLAVQCCSGYAYAEIYADAGTGSHAVAQVSITRTRMMRAVISGNWVDLGEHGCAPC